jgi:hypothetical protein
MPGIFDGASRFIREQRKLLVKPDDRKITQTRHKNLGHKIVVSASSFCYLLPSYHFYCTDDRLGAALFALISVFSALADGSWIDHLPRIRTLDRCGVPGVQNAWLLFDCPPPPRHARSERTGALRRQAAYMPRRPKRGRTPARSCRCSACW